MQDNANQAASQSQTAAQPMSDNSPTPPAFASGNKLKQPAPGGRQSAAQGSSQASLHPRTNPADAYEFRATRLRDEHGVIKPDGLINAIAQRKNLVKSGPPAAGEPDYGRLQHPGAGDPQRAAQATRSLTPASFGSDGPTNIGGRILAIAVNPSGTAYVGTAGGGIWSYSSGVWTPLTDFMASLAVDSLAIDPTTPSTIYAGTGEAETVGGIVGAGGDSIQGAGIFKSTDSGTTWTQLSSTNPSIYPDWFYVSKVAVNSNGVVLAGTFNQTFSPQKLYRSADGGTSWSNVKSTPSVTMGGFLYWNQIYDIAFDPNNPNNAIISDNNANMAYSTDGGATWSA